MLLTASMSRKSGCALERVRHEFQPACNDLFEVAQRIGLTVSEAVGVMDGWDLQTTGSGTWVGESSVSVGKDVFVAIERNEYDVGLAMGRDLATRFGGING